jgi:hypothetical protein
MWLLHVPLREWFKEDRQGCFLCCCVPPYIEGQLKARDQDPSVKLSCPVSKGMLPCTESECVATKSSLGVYLGKR